VEREPRENGLRSWAESATAAEDRIACRHRVYSPVLHLENDLMMMMVLYLFKVFISDIYAFMKGQHMHHVYQLHLVASSLPLFTSGYAECPSPYKHPDFAFHLVAILVSLGLPYAF